MKQTSVLKIGQASKALGVSIDTLRRWEASGKINAERTPGGTRVYSPFVKIGEAAKVLGVSIDTLRRWERAGKITPVRTPGSTRLYSLDELRKITPTSETPSTADILTRRSTDTPINDYEHFSHPVVLDTLIQQKTDERLSFDSAQDYNLVEPSPKPRKIYAKIYAVATLCLILVLFLVTLRMGLLSHSGGRSPIESKDAITSFQHDNNVLAASSIAEIGKFLEINADTVITGNLAVEGESVFGEGIIGKSTLSIAGATTLSTTSINSTLSVTGLTTATGGLTTPGKITLTGNEKEILLIKPSSDPSTATKLFVIQNAAGTEKASIDNNGNASFAGTLKVSGATTLSSTISVSGAATLSGATTISSSLEVSGTTTLSGASTLAGATVISSAGAASTPGLKLTGAWYTGGSTTTTKPQLLVEPTDTTSTGWSASGTGIGVNAKSSFTGNLIDLQVGGTSKFKVDYSGNYTSTGTFLAADGTVSAPAYSFSADTDTGIYRSGTNTLDFSSGGVRTLTLATATSGVNYISITPAATGSGPTLASAGSDTNIPLNLNSAGTGSIILTSANATGTTTSSAFSLAGNSLTSGTGLYAVSSSITTGKLVDIATSGNTWTGNGTTNGLVNLASTSTGGTGSSSSILLNLARSGANDNATHTAYGLYSAVTNSGTTSTNVGGYFTASGASTNWAALFAGNIRMSTGSDILAEGAGTDIGSSATRFATGWFDTVDATNIAGTVTGGSTSSSSWTINSDNATADTEDASLAFERGTTTPNAVILWDSTNDEIDFNSSINLTGTTSLTTQPLLAVATSTNQTTGDIVDITATYAPTAGGTQSAIDVNLTNSNTTSSNTLRGLDITTTDGTALGNTLTNFYSSLTSSGNAAKTLTGYYSTLTSSSTTADTLVGVDIVSTHTGNISSGTKSIYGIRSIPNSSGATDTGGTINTYGGYFDATGAAGGTSSVFGVYIADVSGGDTNVALCFDCDGTYSASTVASGIQFGTDANAVTLYRSASDTLKTDDSLSIGAALSVTTTLTMADNQWIGLGSAAGRLEFDDQTIDEINFLASRVGIGTSTPTSVLHIDQAAETTTATLFARAFIDNTNAITTNTGNTDVYGLQIDEPNITVGTATPTNSASLYITAAATEATNNYALWVDGGDTRLDGDVMVAGATVPTFDLTVTGNIGGSAGPTIAATTQTSTTLKALTSTYITSVAIAPDGFPAVVATGATGNGIWYIKCGNAACSSGNTVTNINSSLNYGIYGSLAIGSDGLPIISYKDNIGAALIAVHCGNITCTAGNTSTTVASETETFNNTSIAVGKDGFPVIAYNSGTSGPIKVAACSNITCSASSIATVDATAGGTQPTIVIGTDGLPILTYSNGNSGGLYVTHCGNATCSSGNTSTLVDSNTQAVAGSSIAIGSDGLPVISYYLGTAGDLSVLHCGNTSCSAGNTITSVVTANNVGNDPSIAIGTDGLPIISHHDATNLDLLVTRCGNLTCSSGNTTTTVDSTGSVGLGTSIAIGTDGLPVVGYLDRTAPTGFKLTQCAKTDCSATTGTALSGGYQLGGWMSNPRSFSAAMQSVNTFQISNPSTFQRLGILTGGSEQVSITPAGLVGIGTTSPTGLLNLSKATFGTPGTTGQYLNISGSTFTDTNTAASGTATNMVFNAIATPTLAASNTSVTTTNAATLYIAAAPTAGTNQTLTNPYALWVDAGAARFDGPVAFGAQQTLTANSTTPSVSAGSHFVTANTTNPTLISNFTNGHNGQILIIELGDSVTDFDCTSSNLNCGAADLTAGATGDIFTFVYDGTNWNMINWMDTSATQTGADIAEWYVSSEALEPGDVVSITSEESEPTSEVDNALIEKSKVIYDQKAIGIVSTAPGIVLGEETQFTFAVALAGRVPVKVSTENGPIEKGDYLTSSSTPGVAMKAIKPGPTIGKALESFSCSPSTNAQDQNTCQSKILTFVNVSWADPGQALANLLLDEEGNLVIPKVKTASLEIGPIGPISQIGQEQENALDVASKLKVIDEAIATQSAQLAKAAEELASASAELAKTKSDVDLLKLTPPEILLATGSATLANIKATETLSSEKLLTALDVNISGVFKALGESFMGNTTIAGNLVVDGTFSISGNSINAIGLSQGQTLSTQGLTLTSGILYLQNNPLSQGLDILNGKFIFDKEGKLTVAGTVEAEQFSVTSGKSAGTGKILAGQTEIVVENIFVKSNSVILVTPKETLGQTLAVVEKTEGQSFKVSLSQTETKDINFDYLIIGVNQKVSGL